MSLHARTRTSPLSRIDEGGKCPWYRDPQHRPRVENTMTHPCIEAATRPHRESRPYAKPQEEPRLCLRDTDRHPPSCTTAVRRLEEIPYRPSLRVARAREE